MSFSYEGADLEVDEPGNPGIEPNDPSLDPVEEFFGQLSPDQAEKARKILTEEINRGVGAVKAEFSRKYNQYDQGAGAFGLKRTADGQLALADVDQFRRASMSILGQPSAPSGGEPPPPEEEEEIPDATLDPGNYRRWVNKQITLGVETGLKSALQPISQQLAQLNQGFMAQQSGALTDQVAEYLGSRNYAHAAEMARDPEYQDLFRSALAQQQRSDPNAASNPAVVRMAAGVAAEIFAAQRGEYAPPPEGEGDAGDLAARQANRTTVRQLAPTNGGRRPAGGGAPSYTAEEQAIAKDLGISLADARAYSRPEGAHAYAQAKIRKAGR